MENPENQGFSWLSEPVDWTDGEELVELWYHIPPADVQQKHLFGTREFHGYVAELYYAGKLVDVRAHPRTLVREMQKNGRSQFDDFWDPELDPLIETLRDFDHGDSMLPKLPSR